MKMPPVGTSVRIIWTDASSDPRGWRYIDGGPLHECNYESNYFTEGTYLGMDRGRACIAPSVVTDEGNVMVAAGDRWWIPVGCIETVLTAKFKVFSQRKGKR